MGEIFKLKMKMELPIQKFGLGFEFENIKQFYERMEILVGLAARTLEKKFDWAIKDEHKFKK